jgi:hypothetical protein
MEDLHLDGAHLGNPNPDCEDCVREEALNSFGDDLDLGGRGELRAPFRVAQKALGLERKKPTLLSKLRDAAGPRLPRPPSLPR